VEIVCQRSGIPLHDSFEGFVAAVRARVVSALGG
jgi:hypothetical protein